MRWLVAIVISITALSQNGDNAIRWRCKRPPFSNHLESGLVDVDGISRTYGLTGFSIFYSHEPRRVEEAIEFQGIIRTYFEVIDLISRSQNAGILIYRYIQINTQIDCCAFDFRYHFLL